MRMWRSSWRSRRPCPPSHLHLHQPCSQLQASSSQYSPHSHPPHTSEPSDSTTSTMVHNTSIKSVGFASVNKATYAWARFTDGIPSRVFFSSPACSARADYGIISRNIFFWLISIVKLHCSED
ncbi:hypothetical protein KC19_2G207200 [Ceratodon purpureus]|uniref:Uncharacterized protein n=1 Tax=Ceratodon purpureus TaxID=3225 RepID=A0A8T0IYL2_CERPU|nr:hypothetical protein KC19_2G207200 [Ceratodon purpureus]